MTASHLHTAQQAAAAPDRATQDDNFLNGPDNLQDQAHDGVITITEGVRRHIAKGAGWVARGAAAWADDDAVGSSNNRPGASRSTKSDP